MANKPTGLPWVYRRGRLQGEQVSLRQLAEAQGTPFFCLSSSLLKSNYQALASALAKVGLEVDICYSLKANPLLAVCRALAHLGAGADIVSGGELSLALKAKVAPRKIVFSGVGKTMTELEAALKAKIGQFNVESPAELDMLAAAARRLGRPAPVALRVNPGLGAGGHDKITTGRVQDKFGIALESVPALYRRAASLSEIEIQGLAMHVGSQIETILDFAPAFARLAELARQLREEALPLRKLDVGGGLPISYAANPSPSYGSSKLAAYARLCARHFKNLQCRLLLEPGRFLVGAAGLLATRVILVKPGRPRDFLIVDAGMNDFIRPALYDAVHPVWPERIKKASMKHYDIAGPVCESSDILARKLRLPQVKAGDMLVFLAAGAYVSSLASTYNLRPLAPQWMVQGKQSALIRPRLEAQQVFARDRLPPWLMPSSLQRRAKH